MADRGRGGLQQPKRPAPVSNPQTGARTDGGAGSKSQPLRVPTGGRYGEAGALEAQQKGAPMAAGQTGTPGGAGPQGPGGPAGAGGGAGAFGPTERPAESNAAQLGASNDPIAASPQAALRAMYSAYPHPSIARLIDWSATGGKPDPMSAPQGGQAPQ